MADTEHMFLSDMRRGAMVAFGISFPQFLLSPFLYRILNSSPQRKMFVLLLLYSFLALVSADVYCSSLIPPYAVPPLESCDAALRALEVAGAECGTGNIIFGPTSSGPRAVRLPAMYIGTGSQDPMSGLICVISILWQPQRRVRPPIVWIDIFPFRNIITAAYDIRDQCIKGSEQYHPRVGRAWIEPHNWVDVQFGSVLGPRGLVANASDVGSGALTVRLADGSIQTVTSSMLGQVGDCGAGSWFVNGLGTNISETS